MALLGGARRAYNRAALGNEGDLTGAVIDERYELARLLGRGGMGAVYEGRHLGTGKRCAVKLLSSFEHSGDPEVVKRFFREARASGLIESPNVVAAFDSGIDAQNRIYYAMELLSGEDLAQALDRVGVLSPRVAVKILVQAATGLARAHELGIIHRDIKPANLFLARGPDDEITVKVLDFGVAKVRLSIFGESVDSLTRGSALLGTPQYMSPEQLKRASSIDEASDVWSLATVLFECLTGSLPWGNAESVGELVAAVLTHQIPSVQDLSPWVAPSLAKVVRDGLIREREGRTQTARAFCDALKQLFPGDARLRLDEIVAPTTAERGVRAERMAFADTLSALGGSGAPVARPSAMRAGTRAALALGVIGAASVAAVMLAGRERAAPRPAPLAPPQLAPVTVSAPPPSAARKPELRRFFLELDPTDALVSVDGVTMRTDRGRLPIEGPVGSVHEVRATLGTRRADLRVAVTNDGLLPPRLTLPPAAARPTPAAAQPPAPPAPRPVPTAAAAVTPTGTPDLSQEFE